MNRRDDCVCALQNRNGLALGIHACDSDRWQYPRHILLHIIAVLHGWQSIHRTLHGTPPSFARLKLRLRSWSGKFLVLIGTFAVRMSPKLPLYLILSVSSNSEYRGSTLKHDIISSQNEVPVSILRDQTAKLKPNLSYEISIHPLGATVLGEPWPPQQPDSIVLYLSSSPSTALSSLLSSLLQHHPSIFLRFAIPVVQ